MSKWKWLLPACFISFIIVSASVIIWGLLKQNNIAAIISVPIFGAIALILAFFQVVRLPSLTRKQLYVSFSMIGIALLVGAIFVSTTVVNPVGSRLAALISAPPLLPRS